jgi:hypothetical protein
VLAIILSSGQLQVPFSFCLIVLPLGIDLQVDLLLVGEFGFPFSCLGSQLPRRLVIALCLLIIVNEAAVVLTGATLTAWR